MDDRTARVPRRGRRRTPRREQSTSADWRRRRGLDGGVQRGATRAPRGRGAREGAAWRAPRRGVWRRLKGLGGSLVAATKSGVPFKLSSPNPSPVGRRTRRFSSTASTAPSCVSTGILRLSAGAVTTASTGGPSRAQYPTADPTRVSSRPVMRGAVASRRCWEGRVRLARRAGRSRGRPSPMRCGAMRARGGERRARGPRRARHARAAAHGGEPGIVFIVVDSPPARGLWRCARNPKLRRRATALARCMYASMTLKALRSRLHPANLPGPPLALVPYKVT